MRAWVLVEPRLEVGSSPGERIGRPPGVKLEIGFLMPPNMPGLREISGGPFGLKKNISDVALVILIAYKEISTF